MKLEQDKDKDKQSYEKPRIRTIELAAEEVLGIGCKSSAGTANPMNPIGCIAVPCASSGS